MRWFPTTIRNRLLLAWGLPLVLLLVAGGLLLRAWGEFDAARQRSEFSSKLIAQVFRLQSLSFDYARHPGPRVETQWRGRRVAIESLLERAKRDAVAGDDALRRLQHNATLAGEHFEQLVRERDADDERPAPAPVAEQAWRERLTGQLLVQAQEMVARAERLATVSARDVDRAWTVAQSWILGLFATSLGVVAVVTASVAHSVTRSIRELRLGAARVAAGNLEHPVALASQDELGALAEEFDLMTTRLRESIAALESEIAHRRVAERQLSAALRDLESFSYSVSHDLRAPLRGVDGFSQAVLEDYGEQLDADGRDMLERIRKGAQRMGVLIDDLLQLSRVSRAAMEPTQVDLTEIVTSLAAELAEGAPDRVVRLEVPEGLRVVGDPRLLRVALRNLVENAWKFTGTRPVAHVTVHVATQDGQQWITVEDNGVGFDPRYADKLFGAFQRLHGQDEFPGSGIGLATVHRIIRRHGGEVRAESDGRSGARVSFSLPETP